MRQGWIVATEQRQGNSGKGYTRVSILDAATRVTSAYNWFRGMAGIVPEAAVEYDTAPSGDGKFTNLTALMLSKPGQAGHPGPMPPSWARVATSPEREPATAAVVADDADGHDATEATIERHSINCEARVSEARRLALGCAAAVYGNCGVKNLPADELGNGTVIIARRLEAWLQGGA